MNDQAEQAERPERVEPATDTDHEALALLADIDPAEAAELTAYKVVRTVERERVRAVSRANAYLNKDGAGFFAHESSARYNPVQKLWIIGYREIERPEELLMGGALIVPDRGPVYETDSMPRQPEFEGIMAFDIPSDWLDVVLDETNKPSWDVLERFVADERANPAHEVYPAPEDVFAALELTPFLDVRVVILGQDPCINPEPTGWRSPSRPGSTSRRRYEQSARSCPPTSESTRLTCPSTATSPPGPSRVFSCSTPP